jgi:hypothetical protein
MQKISSFLIVILVAISGCSDSLDIENKSTKDDSTVFNLVREHQILLTNSAEFIDHSGLNGASSFLVRYQDKVYAITAKHLIGAAGGVEPEIEIAELNKYFKSWKMFPRVLIKPETDTVLIGMTKLNYDLLHEDILLLEVENGDYNVLPLITSFTIPTVGDKLYIIGCPYSEQDCKQNIYEVTFDSYDPNTGMLICTSSHQVEIAGFSGAPLVDSQGNAVGAVTSGWDENNIFYVGATSITKIRNIK